MAKASEPRPNDFFTIRASIDARSPSLSGLCVGYERGTWRTQQFVDHIFEWLPEFALNWTERHALRYENAVPFLRRVCSQHLHD